jgi:multicomponent Na+:H+ antiporter subunit B
MKVLALFLLVVLWLILFFAVGNLPINERVSEYYFKDSPSSSIKTANLVTAITWDYRGYDTFGEETILFTAAVAVSALMLGGMMNARKDHE